MMGRGGSESGFSLIEVLVSLAILMAAMAPIVYVTDSTQRLARSQADAADLQQRTRVAVEKLQRDLARAGAGPGRSAWAGPLGSYLPPVVPARTGERSPDPPLTAAADRFTIFAVPEDGHHARLRVDMPDLSAAVPIDASTPGCPTSGLCGFVPGSRALLVDADRAGAGHDPFTVSATTADLLHARSFSRAYASATSWVVPLLQRVYHFDRAGRRLMLYDGDQSDLPLVDHVVDFRVEYFGEASGTVGLQALPSAALSDGPALAFGPHEFDADLLRVRLVRVTIRLEAAADDVRGTGAWFARPGRSSSGYSFVPDLELTFDVALRNARGSS
jgi:type II secretory pathway pseudopilin PulG